MITLAAHQVNFCPWMPFFDKIEQSDIFVLMGHCQFESANYQNRFRADGNWFTMGVVNTGLHTTIRQKSYSNPHEDWKRIKKSWPKMEAFDNHISSNLWLTNSGIIRQAANMLGITHDIVTDYETHLRGTDRIIEICKTYGAGRYLSGPSGHKYLDIQLFESAGIDLVFQKEATTKKSFPEIL